MLEIFVSYVSSQMFIFHIIFDENGTLPLNSTDALLFGSINRENKVSEKKI